MRGCPRCHEPLPDDATFCYRCRWRGPVIARAPQEAASVWEHDVPAPPPPRGSARHLEPEYDRLLKPVEAVVERPARRRPISLAVRPRWTTVTIAVLAAALALTVGALVRTGITPAPAGSDVVATAPIGPDGAVLPFGPGASVVVPPGAVDAPTEFTVRRFASPAGSSGPLLSVAGAAFSFEPADLEFAVPVTIVFPLPDGPLPDVVLERGGGSTVLRAFVDRGERTISVRTLSFADMAPAQP